MKLALSNFAWDNKNSELIFKFLKENNITQIECILTKIKSWDKLTIEDIVEYKNYLDLFNIRAYSIQSLFYNVDCKITDVDIIVSHFKRLIEYAEILGSKILVFGSPNLRKQYNGWESSVVKIFTQIDELLEDKDIKVVIEPNARVYNGEFWFTLEEIIKFLETNQFNNIKTMIDTHNAELEKDIKFNTMLKYFDKYIAHIHVSEVGLNNIQTSKLHTSFTSILNYVNYNQTITYEVKDNEGVLDSIKTFIKLYQ